MVHGGVKKRGRCGNEMNWSRRKEEVQNTEGSAVLAAGVGIDWMPTGHEVGGVSFCSCTLEDNERVQA